MLIWGWTTKQTSSTLTNTDCTSCQEGPFFRLVLQKFFTLFFIPTFPLAKEIVLFCEKCGCTFSDVSENTAPAIKEEAHEKTPWWGWSGSVLASFLVLFFVYISTEERSTELLIRSQPEVGDVIFLHDAELKSAPYYFIKVSSLEETDLMFFQSTHSYSRLSGAKKAATREPHDKIYYTDEVFQFSREYIKKSKDVRGAIRPSKPSVRNSKDLSKEIKDYLLVSPKTGHKKD
ncbi:MAG TPA: hypothetical protein DD412_06980 [Holosporales bacterium]|nr:hypothetical protein [Holosporales bacterium]